jgi:hypothetical protein
MQSLVVRKTAAYGHRTARAYLAVAHDERRQSAVLRQHLRERGASDGAWREEDGEEKWINE